MSLLVATRLRLRSARYFIPLGWHTFWSLRQARRTEGNQGARVNRLHGAFWTLTRWRDKEAMRAFTLTGAHRHAMPNLRNWCCEASVVHWQQDGDDLPTWPAIIHRMGREGRVTFVDHPTAGHAAGHPLGDLQP